MFKSTSPKLLTADEMSVESYNFLIDMGIDPLATPGERNTAATRLMRVMTVNIQNEEKLAREQG
jgi:hypothetical protein